MNEPINWIDSGGLFVSCARLGLFPVWACFDLGREGNRGNRFEYLGLYSIEGGIRVYTNALFWDYQWKKGLENFKSYYGTDRAYWPWEQSYCGA